MNRFSIRLEEEEEEVWISTIGQVISLMFRETNWEPVCFSSVDTNTCAAAVVDVVLLGTELYVPSTVVLIRGKLQP